MPLTITRKASWAVTPAAVAKAKFIGLAGDYGKRLVRMAKRSAPVTHELGNRRFDDFVLRVNDRVVCDVNRL